MFSVDWLIKLGGTPAVVIVFIMGIMFALYVVNRDKSQRESIRALWAENKLLWADIKELRYKYHQVDKLTYGIGIAIQKATGIRLFKQSADKSGDNALNRDVE